MADVEVGELATPTRSFVLGIADDAGVIDAAALYDAADAVGFTTTRIRLTIRRLVEAGSLTVEGRGRAAAIRLTESGLADRTTDLTWVAAAHRLDAGLDSWDGVWHFAAFEIPERRRAARDAVREALVELLCAPVSGGLYLSPWPIEPWVAPVADAHEVGDRMSYVESSSVSIAGHRDPRAIAVAAWPVDALAEGYAAFVERWSPVVDAPPVDSAAALRAAFGASAQIEGLLRTDPVLPDAALPEGFAGPAARRVYRELLDALSGHDLVANANVFGAYEAAITRALAQTARTFWAEAVAPRTT